MGKRIPDQAILEVSCSARNGAEAARTLGINYKTYRERAKKLGCFKKDQGSGMRGVMNTSRKTALAAFMRGDLKGKDISGQTLLSYLIISGLREYRCERCGLSDWLGSRIVLHAHHKDGDHFNNVIENIEILCPNCHSQTDTYGMRNKMRYDKHRSKVVGTRQRHGPADLTYTCPVCGITRVADRLSTVGRKCRVCEAASRCLPTKPPKDVLEQEVRHTSYIGLGKKYNTSNTTIKRWCRSYGIVLRKRGTRPFG